MATPIFCRRLADSDVNVTSTVMFTDYAGDKITRLMCSPFNSIGFCYQNELKKYIYITLCNPSEESAKDNQYRSEIKM
jgi:hypothetical protein